MGKEQGKSGIRRYFSVEHPLVKRPVNAYIKYRKFLPLVAFFTGFGWDSFTLRRIDAFLDNMILLCYLLLLGSLILVFHLVDKRVLKKDFLDARLEWFPIAIQFFVGGLFSAYVVFYFHSASLSKTALFFIVLVGLLVANEFLKERLTNMYMQMGLFFLASFSFFTFFLPVVLKEMNGYIFLLGGVISLAMVWALLFYLLYRSAIRSKEQYWRICGMLVTMFLVMNLFYVLNWIPPVPLSLKSGGIYHHVERIEGQYKLKYESPSWYQFSKKSDNPFSYAPDDTVFCFTAIFAPTKLRKKVYHHWQQYSEKRGEWITTDKLSYQITGGRDGGFRGYSFKKNIQPGDWRVDVKTEDELLLGQIRFSIQPVDSATYKLETIFR
ncbi:MAG: DUF2914 domain-containing protein [Calditrichia bacterium]